MGSKGVERPGPTEDTLFETWRRHDINHQLTSSQVLEGVPLDPTASSRAQSMESRLIAEGDARLGVGDSWCGIGPLDTKSRSFSFLPRFSFLASRWRSITASIVSTWRWGSIASVGSLFTGVAGGDASWNELDPARDRERAEVATEIEETEPEQRSVVELRLLALPWSETREALEESAVKN